MVVYFIVNKKLSPLLFILTKAHTFDMYDYCKTIL